MTICDESWEQFCLYGDAIMRGSKEYNTVKHGNTTFGNQDADIFDVFNFWREEILGGQAYSKKYLNNMVSLAVQEETHVAI